MSVSSRNLTFIFIITLSMLLVNSASAFVEESPPGVSADNEYFKKGYLDVTLYGADPTGNTDSTDAIQNAINAARDHHLVTFFPNQPDGKRGVYLVSKRIDCMMDKWIIMYNAEPKPNVLVGSTKGEGRPIIKLKDGSSGFSNPSNPNPVFLFWATPGHWEPKYPSTDYRDSDDDISFNQVFKGIDIDLGNNPGAYGIRHPGAQGASIQDVKIDATNAYAGFGKFGVLGFTFYNVEVDGGQYAFYVDTSYDQLSLYTGQGIIVGAKFKNQKQALFNFQTARMGYPVMITGFHVVDDNLKLSDGYPPAGRGGFNLIDGVIEVDGGQIGLDGKNLFLRNVYVKGADSVVNGWNINNKNGWTWIKEYRYTTSKSRNLVDGETNQNEYKSKEEDIDATQSEVLAVFRKHVWDENVFPSFEDDDIVNAKDFGVKGDGVTDDTQALQNLINNEQKIFLPRGKYIISDKITLKPNTQLIGVTEVFTLLMPADSWQPSGETIVLTTEDDKNANTILGFLSVMLDAHKEAPGSGSGFTGIEWRAGRNSMMRNVMVGCYGPEPNANFNYHRFRINNNGGGRHYALLSRWAGAGSENRAMLIENTNEPLAIYAFNAARELGVITTEIQNAKHVRFYYPSHEGALINYRFENSEDVAIFTCTKNGHIGGGVGGVEFLECNDVLVTDFVPIKIEDPGKHALKEVYNGQTYLITNDDNVGLYKRGEPEFTPIGEDFSPTTTTSTTTTSTSSTTTTTHNLGPKSFEEPNCRSGLWIVINKEGNVLSAPMIRSIKRHNPLEIQPEGHGRIKVIMICFKPKVDVEIFEKTF